MVGRPQGQVHFSGDGFNRNVNLTLFLNRQKKWGRDHFSGDGFNRNVNLTLFLCYFSGTPYPRRSV